VNKKYSQLLCYALVISIILVLMGFLAIGVRAFESAEVSNFLFFATLTISVLTPVFYFVWRPIGRADISQKLFDGAWRKTWFGQDRRKVALFGQGKTPIAVERRGKQHSIPLTARSE
jgi:hypothetical protein